MLFPGADMPNTLYGSTDCTGQLKNGVIESAKYAEYVTFSRRLSGLAHRRVGGEVRLRSAKSPQGAPGHLVIFKAQIRILQQVIDHIDQLLLTCTISAAG